MIYSIRVRTCIYRMCATLNNNWSFKVAKTYQTQLKTIFEEYNGLMVLSCLRVFKDLLVFRVLGFSFIGLFWFVHATLSRLMLKTTYRLSIKLHTYIYSYKNLYDVLYTLYLYISANMGLRWELMMNGNFWSNYKNSH